MGIYTNFYATQTLGGSGTQRESGHITDMSCQRLSHITFYRGLCGLWLCLLYPCTRTATDDVIGGFCFAEKLNCGSDGRCIEKESRRMDVDFESAADIRFHKRRSDDTDSQIG